MFIEDEFIKTSGNLLDYFIYREIIDLNFSKMDEVSKRYRILDYLKDGKIDCIGNVLVPYGSLTYGAISLSSDVDILCLSESIRKPRKKYFRFWDENNKRIIPAEIIILPINPLPQDQWYGLSAAFKTDNSVALPYVGIMSFSIPGIWKESDLVRVSARTDADRVLKSIAKRKSKKLSELNESEIIFELILMISKIFSPDMPSFKNAIGELHRRLSNGLEEVWVQNIRDAKLNSNHKIQGHIVCEDNKLISEWLQRFTLDRLVDIGNLEFVRNYQHDYS